MKGRSSPPPAPTDCQSAALQDLRDAAVTVDALTVGGNAMIRGDLAVHVSIDMSVFTPGPGALPVQPTESFTLIFPEAFPLHLPRAYVSHRRWLGKPHVLEGDRLCLFLDPQREWDPSSGGLGALDRLCVWLEDAVAGRHATATALHHGFGGLTSTPSTGAPTLVVRSNLHDLRPGIRPIAVHRRGPHCLEVVASDAACVDGQMPGLVLVSAEQLPAGFGRSLESIVTTLHAPWSSARDIRKTQVGFPDRNMTVARIGRLVRDMAAADQLVLVVAAPNRAVTGAGAFDLMAARLTAGQASEALAKLNENDFTPGKELEFLKVDDVRPAISVRRDDGRPTGWYTGRSVELWGCGALGSWIAELLVRAGVGRLIIRDVAVVSTGLVVRQNYVEADVGALKADALAERLRAIAPDVEITAGGSALEAAASLDDSAGCDLVIDATANAQVAWVLDLVANAAPPQLQIAQVSTDSSSATLGLVILANSACGPSEVDRQVRDHVFADADLEGFRILWDPADDLLTPARGCSTPTFRGSAADIMGVAASAVSLLGGLLRASLPGAHLFALPHSPAASRPLTYVPAQTAGT